MPTREEMNTAPSGKSFTHEELSGGLGRTPQEDASMMKALSMPGIDILSYLREKYHLEYREARAILDGTTATEERVAELASEMYAAIKNLLDTWPRNLTEPVQRLQSLIDIIEGRDI
ncbi:MAG: hypothetical protein WBC49_06075 [Thermoplasmata archaeon]